jgi:hypothetical protein
VPGAALPWFAFLFALSGLWSTPARLLDPDFKTIANTNRPLVELVSS